MTDTFIQTQVGGGVALPRKAKFLVALRGKAAQEIPCISATHVSCLLQKKGYRISPYDVYNWCSNYRPKKRLAARWPNDVQVRKLRASVGRQEAPRNDSLVGA